MGAPACRGPVQEAGLLQRPDRSPDAALGQPERLDGGERDAARMRLQALADKVVMTFDEFIVACGVV